MKLITGREVFEVMLIERAIPSNCDRYDITAKGRAALEEARKEELVLSKITGRF